MSWGYIHFDCCVSTGSGGDATEANQTQILADLATLKQCVVDMQVDVDDIAVGVDNVEVATVKPKLC